MYRESRLLLKVTYQALMKMGVDYERVLDQAGFDKNAWKKATLVERFSHNSHAIFWPILEEVSEDPYIGLHLAQNISEHTSTIHAVLLLSSPTIGVGFKRIAKYLYLLSEAFDTRLLHKEGGKAEIAFNFKDSEIGKIRHLMDAYFCHSVMSLQKLTQGQFYPDKVYLAHDGGENPSEYKKVLGCDVEFGADICRCRFDASILDQTSLLAEPDLFSVHDQLAAQHLEQLKVAEIVEKVKRVIAANLEMGEVTLKLAADQLDIPIKQLREQLSSQNTSLSQLIASRREVLSKYLLIETDEAIDQIVYLTGISEPSTFYRAFKRWTNTTPVSYREQNQSLSLVANLDKTLY